MLFYEYKKDDLILVFQIMIGLVNSTSNQTQTLRK